MESLKVQFEDIQELNKLFFDSFSCKDKGVKTVLNLDRSQKWLRLVLSIISRNYPGDTRKEFISCFAPFLSLLSGIQEQMCDVGSGSSKPSVKLRCHECGKFECKHKKLNLQDDGSADSEESDASDPAGGPEGTAVAKPIGTPGPTGKSKAVPAPSAVSLVSRHDDFKAPMSKAQN
jgi:hypothetical protein